MPCHSAMIKDPVTVSPDDTVEKVLATMKKKKADTVAVLGEGQVLEGLFSVAHLFKSLLPVSVAMADGVQIDVAVQAAPGVAKRLKKVEPLAVSEVMERKVPVAHPETPTWEGVNFIVQYGAPLMIIENETGKFLGMVTYQSALDEIQRLKDSES